MIETNLQQAMVLIIDSFCKNQIELQTALDNHFAWIHPSSNFVFVKWKQKMAFYEAKEPAEEILPAYPL